MKINKTTHEENKQTHSHHNTYMSRITNQPTIEFLCSRKVKYIRLMCVVLSLGSVLFGSVLRCVSVVFVDVWFPVKLLCPHIDNVSYAFAVMHQLECVIDTS